MLDKNTEVVKRPRGRPRKVVIEPISPPDEEDDITCPKCGAASGDTWDQCNKVCPMPESPWFDETWTDEPIVMTKLGPNLPKDTWGLWKRFNVSETSKVFLDWLEEIRPTVLEGWQLKVGNMKKFIRLYLKNGEDSRPFAFIKKSTGDIHCPATDKYPFTHFSGNIADKETRLSIFTPYGVQCHWSFLPTHKDFVDSQLGGEHTDELNEDEEI